MMDGAVASLPHTQEATTVKPWRMHSGAFRGLGERGHASARGIHITNKDNGCQAVALHRTSDMSIHIRTGEEESYGCNL